MKLDAVLKSKTALALASVFLECSKNAGQWYSINTDVNGASIGDLLQMPLPCANMILYGLGLLRYNKRYSKIIAEKEDWDNYFKLNNITKMNEA